MQLGFLIDLRRCVQCHSCQVACKAAHSTELGVQWRSVLIHWEGDFPKVHNRTLSLSCLHCTHPACVDICPAGAITKRVEDGVTVVDQAECIGCRSCSHACPYGAPQYGANGKMQKCDLCRDRRAAGRLPACVATCPADALEFGDLRKLQESARDRQAVPVSGATQPSAYVALAGLDNIEPFLNLRKRTKESA